MVPVKLHDYILQLSDSEIGFVKTRDKVMSLARNQPTMHKPTANAPMDVDKPAGYSEQDIGDCETFQETDYYEEAQVNYVGEGSICHMCEGTEHTANDCGTLKGNGKVVNE